MKAREDIVRALRCCATYSEAVDCTGCPYLLEEVVEGETWISCDVDQIALDAAEMLEADTETILALIDDRKYCMEKHEKLKSLVPLYDYVPPEKGAEDDEA